MNEQLLMKKYPKWKIKHMGFAQINTQDMTEKKKKSNNKIHIQVLERQADRIQSISLIINSFLKNHIGQLYCLKYIKK